MDDYGIQQTRFNSQWGSYLCHGVVLVPSKIMLGKCAGSSWPGVSIQPSLHFSLPGSSTTRCGALLSACLGK